MILAWLSTCVSWKTILLSLGTYHGCRKCPCHPLRRPCERPVNVTQAMTNKQNYRQCIRHTQTHFRLVILQFLVKSSDFNRWYSPRTDFKPQQNVPTGSIIFGIYSSLIYTQDEFRNSILKQLLLHLMHFSGLIWNTYCYILSESCDCLNVR